ncbi:hypothetical protein [Amycolatopsis sp. cmx-11-51]|uniref:hypothetical protein n=1 Tax=Amycolatopsis sp. cmx-11-51 TaxID=2785797 RepID=UPI0039E3EC8F
MPSAITVAEQCCSEYFAEDFARAVRPGAVPAHPERFSCAKPVDQFLDGDLAPGVRITQSAVDVAQ